jgi:hypothetical protein
MHRVEAKLAKWKKLYLELGYAYERLNIAVDQHDDAGSVQALRADVARLRQESAAALEAVQTQIDKVKAKTPDHSSVWIGELHGHETPLTQPLARSW